MRVLISCMPVHSFGEAFWSGFLKIANAETASYISATQPTSCEDPADLVMEALCSHYQALSSIIADMPDDKACAYLRAVVRRHVRDYVRNNVRRRRLLRDRSHLGTRSNIHIMRNLFRSLRLSARSLGVRLITYAKDRCLVVQAKLIADRLACRKIGLVAERGLTVLVALSSRGHHAVIVRPSRCLTYWNPGAREA